MPHIPQQSIIFSSLVVLACGCSQISQEAHLHLYPATRREHVCEFRHRQGLWGQIVVFLVAGRRGRPELRPEEQIKACLSQQTSLSLLPVQSCLFSAARHTEDVALLLLRLGVINTSSAGFHPLPLSCSTSLWLPRPPCPIYCVRAAVYMRHSLFFLAQPFTGILFTIFFLPLHGFH